MKPTCHSFLLTSTVLAAMALGAATANAQATYEYRRLVPTLEVTGQSQPAGSAALELSSSAVNFGSVATNTTATRQVVATNAGSGVLAWSAAPAVAGASEFASSLTSCGGTLAVGASCQTEVVFSPTAEGTFNGTLAFTSTLANPPHQVSLVGTAFNPVSLAAATLPAAKVGRAYSYDFKPLLAVSNEASPDKSLAAWTGVGALPSGLSFNTSTGVLSGTPSAANAGVNYSVTGTYKNNSGQQVYVLVVNNLELKASSLSTNESHTCAVLAEDGSVVCWGRNNKGQLGNNSLEDSSVPVQVSGLAGRAISVATGLSHSCALLETGAARCWGRGDLGTLGNGVFADSRVPVPVALSGISTLTAGGPSTCAITTAGAAFCWGAGSSGRLGNGGTANSAVPVQPTGLSSGVTSISAGANHLCAVHQGAAKCWGYGAGYALGNGSTADSRTPVTAISSGVSSVVAGWTHSCALRTDGAVRCWGTNTGGQLGNGSTALAPSPVAVLGVAGAVQISTAYQHTCARLTDGGLKCWGTGASGQLGEGFGVSFRSTPVLASAIPEKVKDVSAGFGFTCLVGVSDKLYCMGANDYGKLGLGNTSTTVTPTVVPY